MFSLFVSFFDERLMAESNVLLNTCVFLAWGLGVKVLNFFLFRKVFGLLSPINQEVFREAFLVLSLDLGSLGLQKLAFTALTGVRMLVSPNFFHKRRLSLF